MNLKIVKFSLNDKDISFKTFKEYFKQSDTARKIVDDWISNTKLNKLCDVCKKDFKTQDSFILIFPTMPEIYIYTCDNETCINIIILNKL